MEETAYVDNQDSRSENSKIHPLANMYPYGRRMFLPLSYMVLIFATSSIPGDSPAFENRVILAILKPTIQNVLHIPLFGILAMLWFSAFKQLSYRERACITMSAFISIGYGLIDEVYQYFVPGRYMSLTDILLNTLGVFSAFGLYKLASRIKRI